MKRLMVLGTGLLIAASMCIVPLAAGEDIKETAPAEVVEEVRSVSFDGSVGYRKLIYVAKNEDIEVKGADLLSASLSWRIPLERKHDLLLDWGLGEDETGNVMVGYGQTLPWLAWGAGPVLYWLNELGEEQTFAVGGLIKLNFAAPAGSDSEIPVEFTMGVAQTVRPAKIAGADEDFTILVFGLRTEFPVRRDRD